MSPARARVVRRRRRIAGLVLLSLSVGGAALLRPDAGTGQTGGALVALPELGVANATMTLMGAVPAGAPGEAWAYQRLTADVPAPTVDGRRLQFGPRPSSGTPDPQLVFLRHTDDTGWTVQQAPVDEDGRPYRGMAPNLDSARITPRGGGLLLGQDGQRSPDRQLVVLRRHPGGRYEALRPPPATVLLGAGDPDPSLGAESLAGDRGSGRVAVTAYERAGRTAAFFVPVGREVEDAVISYDGGDGAQTWRRERIEVAGETEFRVAAIAADAADEAWLVATSPGDGVRLFRRDPTATPAPVWREVELGGGVFGDAAAADVAGMEQIAPLDGPAETLTLQQGGAGLWIDARVRREQQPGEELDDEARSTDATLFVAPGAPPDERVTSWCDAARADGSALCDQPLAGNAFSRARGYRSFAWAGGETGTRIVTNPIRRGEDESSNRGTYLRFDGPAVRRQAGGGYNFQPSGAFLSADRGWLGGPVEITRGGAPERLRRWPVALRAPLTDATPAPGSPPGSASAGALAVGGDGAIARFVPAEGWTREFLLSPSGSVARPQLRGVAWPESGRAHAVGDLGAMWSWRADTGLWERDPGAPIGFEKNLIDVAFDPADPSRGYAVGKEGTILRYDKSWVAEPVPAGFEQANFTSITFAGNQALAVAAGAVLVNDGSGWRADESLGALLEEVRTGAPFLYVAAGLPDGGAVVAGRNIVIQREAIGQPWRFVAQPTLEFTAVAAAAFREGGALRALLSGVPVIRYPVADPPVEVDPNVPPPILPPFQLPGDGYLLRQTAAGWRDEQRTSFGGSGNDRPVKSDPIAALVVDGAGEGWAIGGWGGTADHAGRGTSGRGGGARTARERVQTAGIFRYSGGAQPPGPPSAASGAPVALTSGVASFAVAGHAECDQPCADLANQSIAPDRMLRAGITRAGELAARPNGPRALLYTGGRLRPEGGQALDDREAGRYAELITGTPLPVYPAVAAGDSADGRATAFKEAFTAAPAPFGTGGAPAGVATAGIPGVGAASGGRTHYAFDSSGPEGTVRVVVIDNSAGSLAASDPYQNPPEPQLPWLRQVLADARARGIASIVVGSRDLNPRSRPPLNTATDGDEVAQAIVDGGASAYFFDRPEENRISAIPSGAPVTIPAFGTGALGYRSPTANAANLGKPDALFGGSLLLLAEIDLPKRDAMTNRAPVAVRGIPVLDDLSLQAVDGTLLRRSRPALFEGLGRRPVAGDRWGPLGGGDGVPSPTGADPYLELPPEPCLVEGCSTRILPEFRFISSNPEVGDFVRQDPSSSNLRKPLLGTDDKVVTDNASGLFCAFNPGTTTVSVTAGGLSYSQQVTVQAGSVQRPCGTRPTTARATRPAAAAAPPVAAPPPPVAPASPPVDLVPPPAPPIAQPTPAPPPRTPAPTPPRPPGLPPLTTLLPPPLTVAGPPPVPVPPPTAFFGQPIPPGGATVRVHEEKREEEAAPEQSSAAARYRPDEHLPLAPFVIGGVILAALAGTALRPPRRDRSVAPAYLDFTGHRDPYRRRRRS